MPAQPLKALNERHDRFVTYYLEDFNASRAARLAGFSEKSAGRMAHDLLKDPLIQDAIKKRQQEIADELHLSLGTILREYKRVAFANLAHVAHWDTQGNLQVKAPEDLDADQLAALCEISNMTIETEGMTKIMQKIKLHPKLPALDKLVRLLGLLDAGDDSDDDGGLASLLEMEKPPMHSPRFIAEYHAYMELRAKWNVDPERYCVERLGLKPTWQQRQVLDAIAPEGARVSVRSGQNTGKDTVTAGIILWFIECKDHPRIPCTAPTAKQLYTILWAELAKWMRKSVELSKQRGDHPRFHLDKLFHLTADRLYDRSAPQDWFAVARTAAAHAPESLQGFHASDLEIDDSGLAVAEEGEANMLVVLDEASGIADSINQVLDGALASPGARELQIGNPNRNTGFFAMTHKHMGSLYTLRHFKSAESPLCDPKFRPRMVKKFGEDSDVVRVRCDGEFPKAEADTLIPLEYTDAALHRQLPELMSAQPLKLGIDCAWDGDDRTAYVLRRGPVIPYLETQAKTEPMAIVGRAVQLIREWGVDEVFVDTIGIGAGVYSRLCELRKERQIACRISAVNVNELAPERQFDSDTQTHLLRDYLWWECRRYFRDDQPVITAGSDLASDLVGELSAPKQLPPDSKGRVRVEAKKETKKRLGGLSPDLGDALCVTFAPVNDQPLRYESASASGASGFKRQEGLF